MHAMLTVWVIFTVVLFVAEPLFLHRWFRAKALREPDASFLLLRRFHAVALVVSLITTGGAIIGAHGGLFW